MSETTAGDARVVALGRGRYLLVEGSRRRLAFGVRGGGETWIFLDGSVHVVAANPGSPRRAPAERDDALTAPMPATVLRVDASAGQAVRKDSVLVVLEAMKMELPLRAPRDGVVKAVRCRPGELAQPGVPLVELE